MRRCIEGQSPAGSTLVEPDRPWRQRPLFLRRRVGVAYVGLPAAAIVRDARELFGCAPRVGAAPRRACWVFRNTSAPTSSETLKSDCTPPFPDLPSAVILQARDGRPAAATMA